MEVTNTMGAGEQVRNHLESDAGHDLLAEMLKTAVELLMDAEVDVLCNAGYGERTDARVSSRNGHRVRRWDNRAGTIKLEIPKLRTGSYLTGLLKPRRRAEQARSAWSARPKSRASPREGWTSWSNRWGSTG